MTSGCPLINCNIVDRCLRTHDCMGVAAAGGPSDAQHTPGPWANNTADETLVRGADGDDVATTFFGEDDYNDNYVRRAADARLIAASPDLLAALKKMHAAFNSPKPIAKKKGDALEAMCCAAIAKAEGR